MMRIFLKLRLVVTLIWRRKGTAIRKKVLEKGLSLKVTRIRRRRKKNLTGEISSDEEYDEGEPDMDIDIDETGE